MQATEAGRIRRSGRRHHSRRGRAGSRSQRRDVRRSPGSISASARRVGRRGLRFRSLDWRARRSGDWIVRITIEKFPKYDRTTTESSQRKFKWQSRFRIVMEGRQQSKNSPDLASEENLAEVRSSLSETAEQVSDYVSDGVEQIRDRVRETTRDREGTVVVVALAAGFGIGIGAGTAPAASSWQAKLAPPHDGRRPGRRVRDRLESMVPEGLAGCFGK